MLDIFALYKRKKTTMRLNLIQLKEASILGEKLLASFG